MENIMSYIPAALIVISAVFAVLYGIDKKLAKKVAIRTVMFIVAVVAFALILTLHGAAKAEWVEATVVESVPVIYEGEECYLVSVNISGKIKRYYSSQNLPKDMVIEVDYVDGRIENSREPEPIWFPPILMLGAVAPIVRKKKFAIKQKMHPDFFMTKEKYEKDAKQHIAIDLEDSRTFVWVYNPDRTKQVFAIPSGVEKAISEATRISPAAFVTTFVPAYGHQAVVFCNYHDHLGVWINTHFSQMINEARKLLTPPVQTPKQTKVGKGGKDDLAVMMVLCTIDEDPHQKLYKFRTLEALSIGDRRTAHLKNGKYKPVTVKDVLPPCFASQLDHPLDWYVTLEVFLLAEHQNVGFGIRKPANGVLTEAEMEEVQRQVDSMICRNNSPIGLTGFDETDPDWYLPRG